MPAFSVNDFFAVLPAAILSLFGLALLVLRFEAGRLPVLLLTAGEALAAAALWRQTQYEGLVGFSGAVRVDGFGIYLNAVCLLGTLLAAWGAYGYLERHTEDHPEFYALLVFAQVGMYLMNSGTELIVLFVGAELAALCFYVLTGFLREEPRAGEAALKYLLLGAFSTALLVYGFSVLYGLTGSTHYTQMALMLGRREAGDPLLVLAVGPILLGLLLKIGAAPLHMWAPDAYDGAPTPASAFLATTGKAAAFGMLLRLLLGPLHDTRPAWEGLVEFAAVASLTVGNLGAVTQASAKRLLAWSSVAHAGYLLLGLAAGNRTGIEALLFYLLVYTLMTAGAFLLVAGLEREGVTDFRGLLYRHPGTAMLLLVLLLSLAGLPPTAGFVAKYLVFLSLIQAKLYWLAVVGGLYVAVSLYYYFRLVREMVTPAAGDEPAVLNMSTGWRAAVGLGALLSLALGLQPENFLAWARRALE